MKICGIYCITNIINNKKYIGQSKHIKDRFSKHKWTLRSNNHLNWHLQKSWNKYGEDSFTFTVIDVCPPEELDAKEIYYITLYDSCNTGYNRANGGKVGYFVREDEQKEEARENWKNNAFLIHEKRLNSKNACKECGAETKSGFNFYCEKHTRKCTRCGKRFPKYKGYTYCEQCGSRTTIFDCPKCGQPFTKNSNRQKTCDICSHLERKKRQKIMMRRLRNSKRCNESTLI